LAQKVVSLSERESQPVERGQANVLEYARPTEEAPQALRVGWVFSWASIGCAALFFFLYTTQNFSRVGMALITIEGIGFSTSLVAIFALFRDWKGLVFSIFGLTLNLVCIGIIAYLLFTD
jgi:hypothetical protein